MDLIMVCDGSGDWDQDYGCCLDWGKYCMVLVGSFLRKTAFDFDNGNQNQWKWNIGAGQVTMMGMDWCRNTVGIVIFLERETARMKFGFQRPFLACVEAHLLSP